MILRIARTFILFFLFSSTVSCANTYVRLQPRHPGIDEELRPYLDRFVELSEGKIKPQDLKTLTMGFYDFQGEPISGMCYNLIWFQEIDISIYDWRYYTNNLDKEMLIFHELGHCLIYRAHTSPSSVKSFSSKVESMLFTLRIMKEKPYLPDGCPPSIMHPIGFDSKCYLKHYNLYIKELFE